MPKAINPLDKKIMEYYTNINLLRGEENAFKNLY